MSRNLWAGLCLTGIGMIFVLFLIPYGVAEPRKVRFAALSPSNYPRIVAVVLTLLGLAVTVRGVSDRIRARSGIAESGPDDGAHPDAGVRIAAVFAILAMYAVFIDVLGFVVMSALALAALSILAGERRFWLIAVNALVLPLALYFFFVEVASIPIPAGILKSLLVGA